MSPAPDLEEELVCGEDGLSLSYPVGFFKESEASPDSFEIALVAKDPTRGLLVCLPKFAWDRKANKKEVAGAGSCEASAHRSGRLQCG